MKLDPDNQEPLGHSPPQDGMPGDPYARHVEAVHQGARERAEASPLSTNLPRACRRIETAAVFHDLGKLDPDTQTVSR